jgi:hypothetical protein
MDKPDIEPESPLWESGDWRLKLSILYNQILVRTSQRKKNTLQLQSNFPSTSWPLVQRCPTECGASLYVITKPRITRRP